MKTYLKVVCVSGNIVVASVVNQKPNGCSGSTLQLLFLMTKLTAE